MSNSTQEGGVQGCAGGGGGGGGARMWRWGIGVHVGGMQCCVCDVVKRCSEAVMLMCVSVFVQ